MMHGVAGGLVSKGFLPDPCCSVSMYVVPNGAGYFDLTITFWNGDSSVIINKEECGPWDRVSKKDFQSDNLTEPINSKSLEIVEVDQEEGRELRKHCGRGGKSSKECGVEQWNMACSQTVAQEALVAVAALVKVRTAHEHALTDQPKDAAIYFNYGTTNNARN